jgi:ribonucleoside-diphosphate reductase beta chain
MEPILTPSVHRFCLFPIKYPKTFELYLQQVASFWTVGEIDLATDKIDFGKLSTDQREFILHVLAFFASSDGIVNENLVANFADEVQIPEIRQFYGFQIGMETIHAHMYALMIDTYVQEPEERQRLFHAVETVPSVKAKAEWAMRWFDREKCSFAERLIAFACVEGVFFSASFCAIFFFKKQGLMPGLTFSNELIARDEGLHRDFACHVYGLLENPLPEERIHEIVRSAVECEKMYVRDALRGELIGMNSTLMQQYVEFVADHLVATLGYAPVFGVENPFVWMQLISIKGKSNFFEKRESEYQKANVMQDSATAGIFALDGDF